MKKKIFISVLAALFLMAALCLSASAEGFDRDRLTDGKRTTYSKGQGTISLEKPEGIAHLYIEFDRLPADWSIKAADKEFPVEGGYLHQYIDVAALCGSQSKLTLQFPQETVIADLYYFGDEKLPDFIQKWEPPCQKADLLLISSHSDDEQLFFAGILPYYAVERKLQVQVAYIVQHFEAGGVEDHLRPHEQLDGLWTVGIRNYPVMSDFPDVYSESKDRATAFDRAQAAFLAEGVTYDDFKGYITEILRRFKPLVVVSHDLDGEYGHGTHVYAASALTEAIALAADAEQFPPSAEKYGLWTPEKTYLHLYEQNQITMDWDTPYESLGGKTPFEVTQEGFGCHKSQHWTWFKRWIYGNNGEIQKAAQIKTYSPCQFGLYQTAVGQDSVGGDFMENIKTYAQREQEAKAEQARLEQEQKAAEEQRIAAEKAMRLRMMMTIGGLLLGVILSMNLIKWLLKMAKKRGK